MSSPENFGLVATVEYTEALKQSEEGARTAVESVMSIGEKYSVVLQFPWNS